MIIASVRPVQYRAHRGGSERHGDAFERVFTPTEQARHSRPFTRAGTLAKRFAAKEACSKALGTGFAQGVFMKDIGVVNAPRRAHLALTGGAAARLASLTPPGHEPFIHLTLTDDHPWPRPSW
jgi:holo-[acyl-carrier protein] synthase